MSGNHVIKITYIDRAPVRVTYVSRLTRDGGWFIRWEEKKARRMSEAIALERADYIQEKLRINPKPWPIVSVQVVV
jgi:hypothetical protein